MTVLREGLLRGRAVAVAGAPPLVVCDQLRALGARLEELDGALDEDRARAWASGAGPLHALVYDAAPAFGPGGTRGLAGSLEAGWIATRAVAIGALIPGAGGKIVLIAPAAGAGAFAPAVAAALQNLARTLSVEWARHGLTAVAVLRGESCTDGEVAELVCFLVSPAGDYFSGCRLELGSR
jgi:NAD(P)-dependent dehydrogenase (short-subunit alcohol dehydrogenase family)